MKTQKDTFKVLVSLESSTIFDSNRQKKRYADKYELYKSLGFEDASMNKLRFEFEADNAKDAWELVEEKRNEFKDVRNYKGLSINKPSVSLFKNGQCVSFELS